MKAFTIVQILILIAAVLGVLSPVPIPLHKYVHAACEGIAEGYVIGSIGAAWAWSFLKK